MLSQLFPVVGIGLYLRTTRDYFFVANCQTSHDAIALLVSLEGQRCDVNGYGDVGVVRVDVWQFTRLLIGCGYLVATGDKQRRSSYDDKQFLHINSM